MLQDNAGIFLLNTSLQRLKNEREVFKSSVIKVGKWPGSKSELTNRNLKQLIRYINSMNFEKINYSQEQM